MAFVPKEHRTSIIAIRQQQEKLNKWFNRYKNVEPKLLTIFFNIQQAMEKEQQQQEQEEEEEKDVSLPNSTQYGPLRFHFGNK